MLFKKKNVDIKSVIYDYHKELSQKCKEAHEAGRTQEGRWWDCQACAMVELEKRIRKAKLDDRAGTEYNFCPTCGRKI